jgi:hypothetical protein
MSTQPNTPLPRPGDLKNVRGLLLKDRWGNLAFTPAEWSRLTRRQRFRYSLFGTIPPNFERDLFDD